MSYEDIYDTNSPDPLNTIALVGVEVNVEANMIYILQETGGRVAYPLTVAKKFAALSWWRENQDSIIDEFDAAIKQLEGER